MAEKYLESYRILLGATNFTTAGLTSARRTCNSRATTGHGSPFGPSGSSGTLPKCTWNGAWYVFGIVVSSDQTPVGRASDALRAELPAVFPDFFFDFIGQEEFELEAGKPASEASHAAATRACSSGCIAETAIGASTSVSERIGLSACSISLGFGGWAAESRDIHAKWLSSSSFQAMKCGVNAGLAQEEGPRPEKRNRGSPSHATSRRRGVGRLTSRRAMLGGEQHIT
jgi:hypothetical protein